jgi:ATP-binding cassette, subfamily B (MDR/TAP), member 1
LAFWYGAQRFADGAISDAGVVLVVIMSVMMTFMSLQSISMPLLDISKAIVAARDLFAVIDTPQPAPGTFMPNTSSQDILFKDVTFEYPSRPGVTVLNRLNICLKSGQNTAIVGLSGSGKSTVVALLERWYSVKDPYAPSKVAQQTPADKSNNESETNAKTRISGSITIGGFNLDDLDLKWWRSHIGLVQQEPFLFNDTIFNNIANGLVGTQWEHEPEERKKEMVRKACEEAYADEFITRLPDVSTLSLCIPVDLWGGN